MKPSEHLREGKRNLAAAEAAINAALKNRKDRSRATLNRQLHEIRLHSPDYRYTSQAGQDAVIDRLLGGKPGTFVDVGGFDGITGSNTLFLEVFRGWTGALVEPVPRNLQKAKTVRRCPCLGFAVSKNDGAASFIEVQQGYTQMSGLAESYDTNMLAKVRADQRHKEEVIEVETRRLSTLLLDLDIPHPDFVSLDIEGGEVQCLEDFPFAAHRVKSWSIENNTSGPEIPAIMRANGYELIEFCGPDDLFVHRDFIKI